MDAFIQETVLACVPADGSAIGNKSLFDSARRALTEAGQTASDDQLLAARDALVAANVLARGKGRGGSVYRVASQVREAGFSLTSPPVQTEMGMTPAAPKVAAPKPKPAIRANGAPEILSYRHPDKRKNNPEVGMVNPATDPDEGEARWAYDPHIDPALQFDVGRAHVEKLIDDALEAGDEASMRAALETLKRDSSPYLNWTGKAERTSFEVDTVSLHVHERIDPASILAAVRKRMSEGKAKGAEKAMQPDLFAAPFENLPLRDAIDFYRHEKGWSNRLIAGDSLLVMNSLLQKEGMAGQVQMIYIDPPYGIKFGSNFQPFVNKRDVKDRKDEDLTQEPEMIKAFRDTWELGIHSYLAYLRDRLQVSRDLLHEQGSVFVQIGDENVHLVRSIADEVFGSDNFIAMICVAKTASQTTDLMAGIADYVVWYAKDRRNVKFRRPFKEKAAKDDASGVYRHIRLPNLSVVTSSGLELNRLIEQFGDHSLFRLDNMTSQRPPGDFPVLLNGKSFLPGKGYWKTGELGMARLRKSRRIQPAKNSLTYVRFLSDFRAMEIGSIWSDMGTGSFTEEKIYVVQSAVKIVERCLLMTTDPGDLVIDPTCGSGTTAFVAEKWGRRWITCDTSRVATTLAKQRLMTASYEYYGLRYPREGLRGGFIYKTVPHVTLKSIANNPDIDEIYERMNPAIDAALGTLNSVLGSVLNEWEVPFNLPVDWPEAAVEPFTAFHAARQTMQRAMDASIAAHAEQEILYDQPQPDKTKLRITGPFSVEAVPFPSVLALAEAEAPKDSDVSVARSGETARQHGWRDELFKTGIRGKGGQILKFAELETLPDSPYLHVTGTLADSPDRVVVSFGPEHATLEQRQVALALNEAEKLRPAPKVIVFAAFEFDPEAAKDIDETKWPGVTLLKAKMNADLLTQDLKKGRASNQSFWLMGQPDVELRTRKDGRYEVEVNGFDYFDTAKGELVSGGKGKIAMWLLDTDYDERSLFPRQVFFPMAGKGEGWEKLRRNVRAELNEALLEQFHGTVSLPFDAGENRKVAVKIVDDRGIESLRILPLH